MTPIRTYRDAWNGALHAHRTPAGVAPGGAHVADSNADCPSGVATKPARRGARDLSRWLEGPVR